MMKRYISTLLILGIILSCIKHLYATKRDDVITEAGNYIFSWTCASRNLKDTDNNEKDDRREYDEKNLKEEPWRWFPLEKDKSYPGEAYGYGEEVKYDVFKTRLNDTTTKWIAMRSDEPRHKDDTIPSGYEGFIGLDCSAFVSYSLGIGRHGTYDLKLKCISVSKDNLKKGDLLFRVAGPHVIVFGAEKLSGDSGTTTIYHSVTWKYEESLYNMYVVRETPEYKIENNKFYLRYKSLSGDTWDDEKDEYTLMTPFPQFTDWSPPKDSITNNPRPEIKVKIKSGTNIKTSSIIMKIDGNSVSPTFSPSIDAKVIVASYTPTNSLSDGQHTVYIYAKNKINLEDDAEHTFKIDTTPPEIQTKIPFEEKFFVEDRNKKAKVLVSATYTTHYFV